MKVQLENFVLVLLFAVLLSGSAVKSLSYDYSASIECFKEPPKPQYEGGGIISNPEFNHGLKGWLTFGSGKVSEKVSNTGNKFAIVHDRNEHNQSISQKIILEKDKLYTFSAWVQVSEGSEPVTVVFRTPSGFVRAGTVVAKCGCWSMLKGGLTPETSGPSEFYFENKNTVVDIWVDSVSLQPFTQEQWRAHQAESIEKIRKRTVQINVVDAHGNRIPGAPISIQQRKPGFPFGNAISKAILTNSAYQSWFTSRFTVTVFENELKWYSTENTPGVEDYSIPDGMFAFCKQHNITIRGHNILWDDQKYQPWWVKPLPSNKLQSASDRRVNSVVTRYRDQVIAWDVMNENLHFSFYEGKLGANASSVFFQKTHQLDGISLLFLNDYNTLEEPGDVSSTPAKYLEKLREIQGFLGKSTQVAIGLEGHFGKPNIPYVRSALDILAAAKATIWLTEVDFAKDPNQAQYLEDVLREAYSHPGVHGIVMWAGWHEEGCDRMCLTDNNFKNLPTGDVVDKLIREWRSGHVAGTTDSDGLFETNLFHGDYEIQIANRSGNSTTIQKLKVDADVEHKMVFHMESNPETLVN